MSENKEGTAFVIGAALTFVICGLVCIPVLSTIDTMWKNAAVSQGFAVYYLDDKHEKRWRWKTIDEIKETPELSVENKK